MKFFQPLFTLVLLSLNANADTWLKGDFHVHTTHSGGDSSVSELADFAKIQGLDFIAITDHDNKLKGATTTWDEIKALGASPVTLIYGMEWTHGIDWRTCHGHMNIWSAHPFDYSEVWNANLNDDPIRAQEIVLKAGALFSINHPKTFGFAWNYAFPDNLPALEIWNGAFRLTSSGMAVREVWSDYFDRGIRVAGVGGSDTHILKGSSTHPTTLGNPTTWVYSKDKTAASILEGVKKGLTAVSFSPDSPIAVLKARGSDVEIQMLGNHRDAKIESVVLYKNGVPHKTFAAPADGSIHFQDETKPTERTWYYVKLFGDTGLQGKERFFYGRTLSISNAVTFGF